MIQPKVLAGLGKAIHQQLQFPLGVSHDCSDAKEGDASVVITVAFSPLFLYRVTILASLMSCGPAPSIQHWQRISCKGCSRVVLQCLIMSGGMLSLPGALPAAKESMALLSSQMVGSVSCSS